MVGDVKQSIYRFRQAMPELFMEKNDLRHMMERRSGQNRAGEKFFRSAQAVTGCVNFFFSQLMSD